MTTFPAVVACIILGALVVFQLLLIAGLPLGRLAWGGSHKVLPARLRIGSVVSIVLYGLFGLVLLDRAELIDVLPDGVSLVGAWVLTAYFVIGVVMNAVSRSKPERYTMTPVALLLAGTCLIVASG
ncbi:hypothetical protein LVY72_08710 [Arthrobacter sp. I2-34]|uniref:Integral membrane protein n=1 Tax=Arthrobacter hankyongi TaxID=2904801 RepID=A0ABS9L689_9MICC|nr:hypothetical protein [Arthrobacter hankyongi]MCG2621997.1 hypothetical protein [Arthrobacter hankyongi]